MLLVVLVQPDDPPGDLRSSIGATRQILSASNPAGQRPTRSAAVTFPPSTTGHPSRHVVDSGRQLRSAQWEEMLLDKEQKIARPRQIYIGPKERAYKSRLKSAKA
jgi:hypothetical protein